VNCSAWTANRPAIAYGCAPQVVLEVPQEVKPVPHVAVMAKAPLGAVTNTLVGVGLNAPLASQETPTTELPAIVESDKDLGVLDAWIRIPPQIPLASFIRPLLLMVASLMSKPAPSRRIPPAVLLLTLTLSSRRMLPLSAVMPGEPPVMVRSRI